MCGGSPYTSMHTCAHTHAEHDNGCPHVVSYLQFLNMYFSMCVHVCMCGAPHIPAHTPTHNQGGGKSPKNSISLELIKII